MAGEASSEPNDGSTATIIVDIVTGASQGIGKAVAESVAHHRVRLFGGNTATGSSSSSSGKWLLPRYRLVMVGRNEERGRAAAAEIADATGLSVAFEACDVGNYREVQALRDRIVAAASSAAAPPDGGGGGRCRVGILVNNAAEVPKRQKLVTRPRRVGRDEDGQAAAPVEDQQVDSQFATNVLGYHFMMRTFQGDMFLAGEGNGDGTGTGASSPSSPPGSPRARQRLQTTRSYVVNIASNWAGDLDLDDLHFQRRFYDNDLAYRQSKQCDRMLSVVWADRLKGRGVLVNACHPGDPRTTLSTNLGYNLWASPPSRSFIETQTPIPHLCGFGKTGISVTGFWFDGSATPHPHRFAPLMDEANRLYDICESYCVP